MSYGWRQTVSWLSLHLLQSPGMASGEGICRIVCRDWMWHHSATQWPGFYAFGAGIHRTIVDELDPILIIRISAPPTLRDVNKHKKKSQVVPLCVAASLNKVAPGFQLDHLHRFNFHNDHFRPHLFRHKLSIFFYFVLAVLL